MFECFYCKYFDELLRCEWYGRVPQASFTCRIHLIGASTFFQGKVDELANDVDLKVWRVERNEGI